MTYGFHFDLLTVWKHFLNIFPCTSWEGWEKGLAWIPEWGNLCLQINLVTWFILERSAVTNSRGWHQWVQLIETEMTQCQLAFPLGIIWPKATCTRPKWNYCSIRRTDPFLYIYRGKKNPFFLFVFNFFCISMSISIRMTVIFSTGNIKPWEVVVRYQK